MAPLGWQHKVGFRELMRETAEADLKLISEQNDGSLRIDRPQMQALFKNEALAGRVPDCCKYCCPLRYAILDEPGMRLAS
jgi:hypothetical protein